MMLRVHRFSTALLAATGWLAWAQALPAAAAALPDSLPLTGTRPTAARLEGLPLSFEATPADASGNTRFLAKSRSGTFVLSSTEALVMLSRIAADDETAADRDAAAGQFLRRRIETRTLHWRFSGANPHARLQGTEPQAGKANYFMGADPAQWQLERPTYRRVQVENIYPGVNLLYYGNQRSLEYDFVVTPGADPGQIAFQVPEAEQLSIDINGDLVLKIGQDELRQHKPVIHQVVQGVRREIAGGFHLSATGTVGFHIEHYDPTWPLVIDPVLSYSTFFGGPYYESAWDVKVDGSGNIYLAGETLSPQLRTTAGAVQRAYGGTFTNIGGDAFVAKFDSTGSNLVYLTYLGGSGADAALALDVDTNGNAYVTGVTDSPNFPIRRPAIQSTLHGDPDPYIGMRPYDAFVTKLNPSGSALIYSTFLGGSGVDQGIAIAVDGTGTAYVTGYTSSTNFPTKFPRQAKLAGVTDVFVSAIRPDGSSLVYSTYLGGKGTDRGQGIAVDALGRTFITGYTLSTNFPTTNAFQSHLAGGQDAFVTVLDATGTNLVWSTYLGGTADDRGSRIALDGAGKAYVVGTEGSGWLATGMFPATPGKLNPGGVYRSTDGGATWTAASAGLMGVSVSAVAIDPSAPNQVYVGTGRGFAYSSDGGLSWQRQISTPISSNNLAPLLEVASVNALSVDPVHPAIVYAGTRSGVYKSLDAGRHWLAPGTGMVTSASGPYIYAVQPDPITPSILYAASSARGIYMSTNSATNWTHINTGLKSLLVYRLAIDPLSPTNLFAATAAGVYATTNRGLNWSARNTGLTNLSTYSTLAIDPQTPSTLYVAGSPGLFKSTDSALNWTRLSLELSATNWPENIFVDPNSPATVYVAALRGLYKSLDAGATWTVITNGLGATVPLSLAIDPGNSANLILGTSPRSPSPLTFPLSSAFLAKLDADAHTVVYSTVFGDSRASQGWAVAVDRPTGNAYITGGTSATNFPTAQTSDLLSATNHGAYDVFVTAVNADASAFLYSVYLGGQVNEWGYGIALDPANNAYVVGRTGSSRFPIVGGYQKTIKGGSEAFLAKILADQALTVGIVGDSLQLKWPAYTAELRLESRDGFGAEAPWTPVLETPIVSNGWHVVTLPASRATSLFRLHRQ